MANERDVDTIASDLLEANRGDSPDKIGRKLRRREEYFRQLRMTPGLNPIVAERAWRQMRGTQVARESVEKILPE